MALPVIGANAAFSLGAEARASTSSKAESPGQNADRPQDDGGLMACLVFGSGRAFRLPAHEKAPPEWPGRALRYSGLAPKISFGDDAKHRPAGS